MIEVRNLVKWYGPTLAVDNLSFTIPKGQIVGFLGPNGAGKSTTLRMLTGFIPPTSGSASIAGFDVTRQSEQARAHVGYLPESTPLYTEMRVEEYLRYRGKLLQMDRKKREQRINVVCDRCGLSAVRRKVIGYLSKGNRQRVGLAQALLHEPPVIILDEPTAGLDPNQIGHVRDLIDELKGKHTILLSSHILPEVERTADRVLIISRGRIVAEGTPTELRRNIASTNHAVVLEVKADAQAVKRVMQQLPDCKAVDATQEQGWCRATIVPKGDADLREAVANVAMANHWLVRELRQQAPTLEQLFVQITAEQSQAKGSDAA